MFAIRRSVIMCALTGNNILGMTRVTWPLRGFLITFDFFGTQGINTADDGLNSKCVLGPKFYTADKPLLHMNYLLALNRYSPLQF